MNAEWICIALAIFNVLAVAAIGWLVWTRRYCPRCKFYIGWRDRIRKETGEPPLKENDPW